MASRMGFNLATRAGWRNLWHDRRGRFRHARRDVWKDTGGPILCWAIGHGTTGISDDEHPPTLWCRRCGRTLRTLPARTVPVPGLPPARRAPCRRLVLTYGCPELGQACAVVDRMDALVQWAIADLYATLTAVNGVGIAANQVGLPLRIALVDPSAGTSPAALRVLINPEILATEGGASETEACLSVPGGIAEVTPRARRVVVRYRTLDWTEAVLDTQEDARLARIIQHECDHLDGVLFVDRLSGLKQRLIARRLGLTQKISPERWDRLLRDRSDGGSAEGR